MDRVDSSQKNNRRPVKHEGMPSITSSSELGYADSSARHHFPTGWGGKKRFTTSNVSSMGSKGHSHLVLVKM